MKSYLTCHMVHYIQCGQSMRFQDEINPLRVIIVLWRLLRRSSLEDCFTLEPHWQSTLFLVSLHTVRSQIEGYIRLLIFRKFSILPAVIWASPFINIQENFQPFCFFTYTNDFFPSSPLLLEPTCLLNLDKNSSLPFY